MPVTYRKSKLFRRSRVIWGSFSLWRPRFIFWLGAIAIGVVSVAFAKMADLAQKGFASLTSSGEFAFLFPLFITPLGFMLSACLAAKFFPNSQGSGIPQAIAARHLHEDEDRGRLLSLPIAFGKIVLTVLGLFCGASIGREGPTVQVGGSIMLAVARFGGMTQARGLILAGSAAGIAAAFNTPLAGIVFAIEEMSRNYEARANGIVLTAVILSGLAALGLAGSYNYFGEASVAPAQARDWVLVLICGFGGGALGACFSGFALHFGQRIRRWLHPQPLGRAVAAAGLCGLAVAAMHSIEWYYLRNRLRASQRRCRRACPACVILCREAGGKLPVDALGHPGRHLRALIGRGRRIRKFSGNTTWDEHCACLDPGDGRLLLRCRSGTDDRVRDYPGNDG